MVRIGSQTPALEYMPPGRVSDAGREIAALAKIMHISPAEWQMRVAKAVTAKRADGKNVCFEFALEVPRQNGKTEIIKLVVLYHLFLVEQTRKIVFTAHEYRTTVEIFENIVKAIHDSALHQLLPENGVRYSNDNRSITTKDGSRVIFMTRSANSGRGFSSDLLIMDEAYSVKAEQMMAIIPVLTTRANPQIIYLSSTGMLNSVYFNSLVDRAQSDDPGRFGYMGWFAPKGTAAEDVDSWYVSNPMLGILFDEEYVWDELRAARNDPEVGEPKWQRERQGMRESVTGESVLDMDRWSALAVPSPYASPEDFPSVSLAIDVPPSRDSAAIGLAAWMPDGRPYVELIDQRDGTSWVPGAMRSLKERLNVRLIGLDEGAAAGGLVVPLRTEARIRHRPVTLRQYAAMCGRFFDLVMSDDSGQLLAHFDSEPLTRAISGARKTRRTETAWTWSRKDSMVDISPLVAVTIALGLLGPPPNNETEPSASKGKQRRVLVM